jgi:type I restriction enzyme M protein
MKDAPTNKYCSLSALQNESDVEQFFVLPLLADLGYGADYLDTKAGIEPAMVGKGNKRKQYFPDYVAYLRKSKDKPVIVVDAKHPNESAEEGVDDAQLYASVIRRHLSQPKPDQYCVGINGHQMVVKHYDTAIPAHRLGFADFVDGNPKFESLKADLSRDILAAKLSNLVSDELFAFRKVVPSDLPSIFETCHRRIWKSEKRSPASAFYEFAKIMFVKIDEDKRLRERLSEHPKTASLPEGFVPRQVVHFASYWISEREEDTENPVNTILFANLAERLEEQIEKKEKKRIFDKGEGIKLAPSTIKEVVRLLQHLDLGAVDEDLNGRMFETFLTATMRGEALGQFFTPRTVVKFMVRLGKLKASRNCMDTVLDGCCGTGGFLIEAMADMGDQLLGNASLTVTDRNRLLQKLRTEALWGIDAGSDPPIARIARLNMHLHRDGGSRIYQADALDKQLRAEAGLPLHTRLEIDELRSQLVGEAGRRFSIVLTNPPFSMTYERKNPAELAVLRDYRLLLDEKGRQRTSLKSSVLFLERYWDLLENGGRLLTVMDDSVLNTTTNRTFRQFVLDHFVIKAVISLPKNTFVKAQGTVSTSVLYLCKKNDPTEPQPAIFMAICNNVGHSDSGKERPHLNELPGILESYLRFEETGKLPAGPSPKAFSVSDLKSENPTLRLDAQFFNPRYFTTLNLLDTIADERGWSIVRLRSLLVDGRDALAGGATPLGASYPDEGPKFIRVQNVRPNQLVWSPDEDPCIDTATHDTLLRRSQLAEGDVVYTITGTYGVAAVVPLGFGEANINQHSVRIRVKTDEVTPEYLSAFLNSNLSRPQVDRAVTGSSRLALDYKAIRELRILLPPRSEQVAIASAVVQQLSQATELRTQANSLEADMAHILK